MSVNKKFEVIDESTERILFKTNDPIEALHFLAEQEENKKSKHLKLKKSSDQKQL